MKKGKKAWKARKYWKYEKNQDFIYLPRQCLRDGAKALSLLGFLDGNVEFTPLEDRIGITLRVDVI